MEVILHPYSNEIFNSLNLELNPKRSELFADLINAFAKQKGQENYKKQKVTDKMM